LGYHGLGDVFVFVFFGLIAVCGTAFVQIGSVPALAWAAAVPIGALATTILVVNNVRDISTDVKSGKRTLAVRWGRNAGVIEYGVLLALAHATPVTMLVLGWCKWPVLLPLLTAPLSFSLFGQLREKTGRDLNALLVASARGLFLFGALFALGIALS
jgi:1,4-dihydroxy-2-naphthoate octaprenyltransferase